MEIVYKKLDEIKPYEKNPRKNDEAVEYVANSIKEFGFKVPIVIDKSGIIVAGHTRYKASKKLGLEEVPCIIAEDLTDEQIKAFRLADNKVSEKAKWNKDLLMAEIMDLNIDMSEFGFEEEKEEEEVEGEIEFGEILGEEHNYVVLFFDNEVDWLQAESLLGLKQVKCGSTRKDGVIKSKMNRTGIGRVINGRDAINRIRGE